MSFICWHIICNYIEIFSLSFSIAHMSSGRQYNNVGSRALSHVPLVPTMLEWSTQDLCASTHGMPCSVTTFICITAEHTYWHSLFLVPLSPPHSHASLQSISTDTLSSLSPSLHFLPFLPLLTSLFRPLILYTSFRILPLNPLSPPYPYLPTYTSL